MQMEIAVFRSSVTTDTKFLFSRRMEKHIPGEYIRTTEWQIVDFVDRSPLEIAYDRWPAKREYLARLEAEIATLRAEMSETDPAIVMGDR